MSPDTGRAARGRTRLLTTCAAVAVGILLAAVGYVAGHQTREAPATTASAAAPAALDSYAERQRAVNVARVPPGDLSAFAEPWMATVSDCRAHTDTSGPALADGEQARIQCNAGVATLYLVSYRTVEDKTKARTRYVSQAAAASSLAPQPSPPAQRATPSGKNTGWYIEYAYKVPAGDRAGDVVVSTWWENEQTLAAGYLVAYWNDGLAARWKPLRDLWRRHS